VLNEPVLVGLGLQNDTMSFGSVQIWQDNLLPWAERVEEAAASTARTTAAAVKPLPSMLISVPEALGVKHHYIRLEPGLEIINTYRTTDSARRTVVLARANHQKIQVPVGTGYLATHEDQEQHPQGGLSIFRRLPHPIFTTLARKEI